MAEPCRHAAVVPAGAPAPCDGVLWPTAWSAEAVRDRRVRLPALQAKARHAALQAAADLEAARADAHHAAGVAAAQLEAEQARSHTWRELAEARAAPLASPPVAPAGATDPPRCRGWVWGLVGVAVGAAAAVGVAEGWRRWSP
jgi:hypothetical protein